MQNSFWQNNTLVDYKSKHRNLFRRMNILRSGLSAQFSNPGDKEQFMQEELMGQTLYYITKVDQNGRRLPDQYTTNRKIAIGYSGPNIIPADAAAYVLGDVREVPTGVQGGGGYENYGAGEGNISPGQFRDAYAGKTESQIMLGESSFLGYKYPNRMADKSTRFVMLANGNEVDMIHFMVVGRAGHALGFANELHQAFRFKSSAFNPQDLYSNRLGVNFFRSYGSQINQNPRQISNYIYQYFNSPGVLNPARFQPQFPTGPKY